MLRLVIVGLFAVALAQDPPAPVDVAAPLPTAAAAPVISAAPLPTAAVTAAVDAAAQHAAVITEHSFFKDYIAPFVATYIGASICDSLGKLEQFVQDITELTHGVDVSALHQSVLAGTLAASTGLVAGGCLTFAPIIFGAEWLHYTLVIFASLVGLVGSTELLSEHGIAGIRLEILWADSAKCVATLAIQVASAYVFGHFVNDVRHLAFFAIGAAASGLGAYIFSETIVDFLSSIDFITQFIAFDAITEHEIVVTCGVLAIIGGIIFGRYHDQLIDTALGLLGGALIGQGLITIALADWLSTETATKLNVEENYLLYVVGVAIPITALRACVVSAREGGASSSSKKASSKPAAKVSPTAEKARNLSKKTPASTKDMH